MIEPAASVSNAPRTRGLGRVARGGRAASGFLVSRPLRRLEHALDASELSQTAAMTRLRRVVALAFAGYAVVLEVTGISHGDLPVAPPIVFMVAIALFVGRGGRFLHYFVPVILGLCSYVLAGRVVQGYKLPVHYTPQIRVEKWLTGGVLPTQWLQEHLYHGGVGPLEIFSVLMYTTHFLIPLALGLALVISGRGRGFALLMFSLLAVAILGETTFILAPTAPPWLASEHGYLPPIHHVLKDSLYNLHLDKLGAIIGDPHRYDVTAAIPSLHVAFPLVCLFAAARCGLPRWVVVGLGLNTLGVLFAIVYMGEHYLVDGLAGAVYAVVAWWLVTRLLPREITSPAEPVAPQVAPARAR